MLTQIKSTLETIMLDKTTFEEFYTSYVVKMQDILIELDSNQHLTVSRHSIQDIAKQIDNIFKELKIY